MRKGQTLAGDWIKIEHVTPGKPEVDIIADLLEIDADRVVGVLVRIWIWADQQSLEGNAVSVTKSAIDRHAGVTGFANAMQEAGWLVVSDGQVCFPNLDRHIGQTAKRRALTAKRVSDCKKRKGNAASVTAALPREEKRREELPESAAHSCPPVGERDGEPRQPPIRSADLDRIYAAYPRKVKPIDAKKAIRKAVIRIRGRPEIADPIGWLLSRVEAFAASPAGQAGTFTPHPATWFNAGSYDDDESEWQRERGGKHGDARTRREAERAREFDEGDFAARVPDL